MIKQRKLRKEQARLHKQQLAEQANNGSIENSDIETNQQDSHQTENGTKKNNPANTVEATEKASHDNVAVDDKKAKIAAVIAKAKAKKLAQKDQ